MLGSSSEAKGRGIRLLDSNNFYFVKIIRNPSLSDGFFCLLWHFSTPKARNWLKSNGH